MNVQKIKADYCNNGVLLLFGHPRCQGMSRVFYENNDEILGDFKKNIMIFKFYATFWGVGTI